MEVKVSGKLFWLDLEDQLILNLTELNTEIADSKFQFILKLTY